MFYLHKDHFSWCHSGDKTSVNSSMAARMFSKPSWSNDRLLGIPGPDRSQWWRNVRHDVENLMSTGCTQKWWKDSTNSQTAHPPVPSAPSPPFCGRVSMPDIGLSIHKAREEASQPQSQVTRSAEAHSSMVWPSDLTLMQQCSKMMFICFRQFTIL